MLYLSLASYILSNHLLTYLPTYLPTSPSAKDSMYKTARGTVTKEMYFNDDGFSVGVAYCLAILKQVRPQVMTIYPSIHPSIYPSIHPSAHPSFHPFKNPSIHIYLFIISSHVMSGHIMTLLLLLVVPEA